MSETDPTEETAEARAHVASELFDFAAFGAANPGPASIMRDLADDLAAIPPSTVPETGPLEPSLMQRAAEALERRSAGAHDRAARKVRGFLDGVPAHLRDHEVVTRIAARISASHMGFPMHPADAQAMQDAYEKLLEENPPPAPPLWGSNG